LRAHLKLLIPILVIALIAPITANSEITVEKRDTSLVVDNGFIRIVWDLEHGGAIKNIVCTCPDFRGTPVGSKGSFAVRGGGGMPAIETVLWDLITTGSPWYGPAVTTPAEYRVVEQTENYTVIEISYTTGDPLPGLRVVKRYGIRANSFTVDFNMTLINTGTSPLTIDVSGAWGRASGPMLEMVGAFADPSDEMRFIMYRNGTVETYEPAASWISIRVTSDLRAIGIYESTSKPSPWGFMLALFMADDGTIDKTSYVWFEQNAGGQPNILIRVEFQPVTLNPGESVEYRMKLYAGPIHYDYLKELVAREWFDRVFYSPELSPRKPCVAAAIQLLYSVDVELEVAGGAVPKTTVILEDPHTGSVYNQVEVNATSFKLGMPFSNTLYRIRVEPTTGLTVDGLGKFKFIGFTLPDGTYIEEPVVEAILSDGDKLKLKFRIEPLARLELYFVTPDMLDLPDQAGNINFSVYTSLYELVYSDVSKPGFRSITVKDARTTPPTPGLNVPETYIVRIPVKAGVYTLERVLLNDRELRFSVIGDQAQVAVTLEEGGVYQLKLVYSAGVGAGFIAWVAIIAVLAVVVIIAFILKARRK